MKSKIASYLGLSMRMGRCAAGQAACKDAIKKRKAALVLIDEAASESTKEQFQTMSVQNGITAYIVPQSWEIGKTIGKGERVLVAVTDKHLAGIIKEMLAASTESKEVEA